MSFRGELINQWESLGRPQWAIGDTIKEALKIDDQMRAEGVANPAGQFRAKREDAYYVQYYVHGMRLPWLRTKCYTS